MFAFPAQPSSILKIIAASWQLYKKSFGKMWYIFALYWLTTLYWLFGYAKQILPMNAQALQKTQAISSTMLLIFLAAGFLISLFGLYLKWVAFHRIYGLAMLPKIDLVESLRLVKAKFFVLFANQILVMFLVVILFMPFMVPGIILMIMLLFCIPLIIFSGHSVTSAIKESFDLVWGNWWRTFLAVLLPLLLSFGISIMIPYAEKHGLLIHYGMIIKSLSFFLGFINAFIILPFLWSTILLQFNDLKLRKKMA